VRPPFNVNRIAQVAAIAALDDQEHVKKSKEANVRGRAFLEKELTRLNLVWYPSQANFILIDFKKPADSFYEALMKKGFITRPVDNYGLDTCLRITIGTQEQNQELVGNLESILK